MNKFNQVVEELLSHPMAQNLPPMPDNRHGLKNGTKLVATQTYSFFQIAEGEEIALWWDGEYVRHDGLTWSIESISNEIDHDCWKVA